MPQEYEATLAVDGTVIDILLAEDEEQAGEFAVNGVENAIEEALKVELTGGEINLDIEVESIEVTDK